ncbi:hypothetical protein [Agromyces lapidis]|uniref:Uncharacterized protein n=1 Tax=Agromyces lapidis TaxID=279574 RepID=A0ABV5SVN2_9MICO|nr:hypothetical protein [Agromyces lapidis]
MTSSTGVDAGYGEASEMGVPFTAPEANNGHGAGAFATRRR